MAEYTLNPKITKLIDDLVNEELFASYHYKSAYAWCALKNYVGGKKFFDEESKDEQEHATGLIEYAADWGYVARLTDISQPDTDFVSLADIIQRSLELEYALCEKYKAAYKTALEIQPNAAVALFAKYIDIQDAAVREYANLMNDLARYGDTPLGISMFDKDVLGA